MTKLLILTAAIFVLSAGSELLAGDASAPSLNEPAQTDTRDHNWTGFYMGVDGGYGTSNTNAPSQTSEPGVTGPDGDRTDQPPR
jgi:hypothetical protein